MLPLLPVLPPADSQYRISLWCAGTMLPLLPVGRQTHSKGVTPLLTVFSSNSYLYYYLLD